MPEEKPFWFKWYPDKWLSSTSVNMMTLEEQGAYFRLLNHSYPNGLPNNNEDLQKLSGLSEVKFKSSSSRLRAEFTEYNEKLYHEILIEEYENYKKRFEGNVKGGKHSAKVKKQKKNFTIKSTPSRPEANHQVDHQVDQTELELELEKEKELKKEQEERERKALKEIYKEKSEIIFKYYKDNIRGEGSTTAKAKILMILESGKADEHALIACIDNYCDSDGSTSAKFMKQATTFFGPSEHWKDYMDAPMVLPGPQNKQEELEMHNRKVTEEYLRRHRDE